MLECPVTEYNYTKRIAYIVCTKYPECTKRLYSDICEKEISTDAEFVDLLKNEFTEVYNDPKVADILDILSRICCASTKKYMEGSKGSHPLSLCLSLG